jgi:hypothetical protein
MERQRPRATGAVAGKTSLEPDFAVREARTSVQVSHSIELENAIRSSALGFVGLRSHGERRKQLPRAII